MQTNETITGAGDGAKKVADDAGQLLKDFQDIDFLTIVLVVSVRGRSSTWFSKCCRGWPNAAPANCGSIC